MVLTTFPDDQVPNQHFPVDEQGRPRWPANDAEAQAAGLDKLTRISDGAVVYAFVPDRREIVAGGEYTHVAW